MFCGQENSFAPSALSSAVFWRQTLALSVLGGEADFVYFVISARHCWPLSNHSGIMAQKILKRFKVLTAPL